jgi:hypothetical protein
LTPQHWFDAAEEIGRRANIALYWDAISEASLSRISWTTC